MSSRNAPHCVVTLKMAAGETREQTATHKHISQLGTTDQKQLERKTHTCHYLANVKPCMSLFSVWSHDHC